jgi:CheY-like chemotaxis protein
VPRILLAEGHAPTRDFVHRRLADAGFEVLAATDSRSAFELFASRRPDAVVLGADFVAGDGSDLVRRLREADPRLLLVVTDKEHMGRARGLPALLPLGANAYVPDPTRRELVERVSRLVEQATAARPAAASNRQSRPALPALPGEPEARGDLRVGVVARLVHQIWKGRTDGVLVLEQGGSERRFLFSRGAAAGFWSRDAGESLLRWVTAERGLPDEILESSLEALAGGLTPGSALVAAGVVEAGEPLLALLRSHLAARLARAVGTRDGRWRFHAGREVGVEGVPVELAAPLQPVLQGARAGIPAHHQLLALRAVTSAYPVCSAELQALAPAAALSEVDRRLAATLDGRMTTRDWIDTRRTELRDGLALLWFLSLAGAVVFPDAPTSPTPVPVGSGARRRRSLPPDRAEALRQAALQIVPASHFRALGLDVTAETDDVERAYHEVAQRYHPDGFAEWDVGDVEDLLTAVQDKVSAAYRALSSADRRRAYLSVLVRRLELTGQRRPGLDPRAEVALFRAERALRARRVGEAISHLRTCVEISPREPEYQAVLAFATLLDPALDPEQRAVEARRLARRALALHPDHPRAMAALSLAQERLADATEARRVALAGLRAHPASPVLREVLRRLNRPR